MKRVYRFVNQVPKNINDLLAQYDKKTRIGILVATVGVLAFGIIASSASFHNPLFNALYPKAFSNASTGGIFDLVPTAGQLQGNAVLVADATAYNGQAVQFVTVKPSSLPSITPTATPTSTPLPTTSPTPFPSGSGFPITSANLKNKWGTNAEPNMRPWHYNGPQPDGWFCDDAGQGNWPGSCLNDPANPNPYQQSGILTMIDREMQLAAQSGVGLIRIEFDWPLIETSKNSYDWSRADYIVQESAKYNLQLQPILVFTPLWASSQPGNTSSWASFPASNDQYWTDFVTKVVSRYKNTVHYWELWNEPDGGNYWWSGSSTGAQDFTAHILNPGYTAVRAGDPTAKVTVGPDHADTAWFDSVYAAGGGNSFDILSFHSYTNAQGSEISQMQSWLNSHGMGSKPIWLGEIGVEQKTASGAQDFTTNDTAHVALLQNLANQTGVQQITWYTLRDELPRNCCPISGGEGNAWGLVQHNDTTLKNGYATMQSIAH